jgi:hypothetical protein
MKSWDTAGRMNEKLGYNWKDECKGGKQLTGWMRIWDTTGRMMRSWDTAGRMNEKLVWSWQEE